MPRTFPPEQRPNLCAELYSQLVRIAEERNEGHARAFSQLAMRHFGFDEESGVLSDGPGDHGVDYWHVDDTSATIFQFKSHDFIANFDPDMAFGPECLSDIPRVLALLAELDKPPKDANQNVQSFVRKLRAAIQRSHLMEHDNDGLSSFPVTIYLCCLASRLTLQAMQEFHVLQSNAHQFRWPYGPLQATVKLQMIDNLLSERWRETNTDWRTSDGRKADVVTFHVCGDLIDYPKSCVFFAKAHDFVTAFDQFGYQIFEPNVRCELKRSKVNEAIRNSVSSHRGRREFKHLNNGITLISASFAKKRRNDKNHSNELYIEVRQPGVINGLQTVKSIHDAFEDLEKADQEHFRADCEVLVRLHTRDAVSDYRDLVKSTNNQNPMQARNLRSNDPEQLEYERLFADLGWFYQRKEGAWAAYKSDHRLWGSLRGKKVSDFSVQGVVKSIDNLELSQSWLSFMGFSNEAVHDKKDIFTDDRFYELVFQKRIRKHGIDYGFRFRDEVVRSEALSSAPAPDMLLFSYLLKVFADQATPTRKAHRELAITRLKLQKRKKEEQDAELSGDADFITGLVLLGAKFLFPEFCGFVLFRALGEAVHTAGPKLFSLPTIHPILKERNFEPILKAIDSDDIEDSDLLVVLWRLYNYALSQVVDMTAWRQAYEQSAVRSRFNYGDYNRRSLYQQLDDINKVLRRRELNKPWSGGMERHKGVFDYVRALLR